ncbi:MAG: hypothetical protein WKF96_03090 [Solirubrobacteraceae bacterium]
MAKHHAFYEFNDDTSITCPGCGWQGFARDCSKEYFSELFDESCPRCDQMVAIVAYPTHEETRRAAAAGNERAIAELANVERREAFWEKAEASELKDPSQLPKIGGDRFELLWDKDGDHTVVRHGEREIWREVAYWEGGDRFAEVFTLLRRRYGWRLDRLVPTQRSLLWLGGDRFTADCKRAEAGFTNLDPGGPHDLRLGTVTDSAGDMFHVLRQGHLVVWRSPDPASTEADAERLRAQVQGHYRDKVGSVTLDV